MLAALQSIEAALQSRQGSDSWNLHLDKLSFDRQEGVEATKALALRRVMDSWRNKSQSHIKNACERNACWLSRLASQHGARFRRVLMASDSRLLLHLGRASVLENVGLYCDRTTGLSLIPGTALKGVLSTWACWEANITKEGGFNEGPAFRQHRGEFDSANAEQILGDDSAGGSKRSGAIVFVGGFPAEPAKLPRLEQDIVTPHPANGRGRIIPNVFLSWARDALWHFVFLARPGTENAADMLGQVECWLVEALTATGIGAKTAAGYGRFRPPTDEERERIRRLDGERLNAARKQREAEEATAKLKQLPPEERAFAEYVANQKDWLAAARDIDTKPDEERQQILRFFRSDTGQALMKTWTNEKGKKRTEALRRAGL